MMWIYIYNYVIKMLLIASVNEVNANLRFYRSTHLITP